MAIGNCNRTLYVEDHADTREVVCGLLTRHGLAVDQAANANDAMALATNASYDLLLIDIGLPGMSGLELLPKLRENAKIPSIAITAYAYPRDVQSCYDAGFDRCLIKPVQLEKLLSAIKELCA